MLGALFLDGKTFSIESIKKYTCLTITPRLSNLSIVFIKPVKSIKCLHLLFIRLSERTLNVTIISGDLNEKEETFGI